MLSGETSFREGADQVLGVRALIRELADADDDADIAAFVSISSQTDHLPRPAQRPLWSKEAWKRLEGEFEQIETWASEFAVQACRNLIARFETCVLYRPTGPEELELVRLSGWRRWPPRLAGQPIFYPVTNEAYADEIAARWNVKEHGAGYVTRFEVRTAFMNDYPVQKVGGEHHTEWWIPAEKLDELNDNIVGLIELITEYRDELRESGK